MKPGDEVVFIPVPYQLPLFAVCPKAFELVTLGEQCGKFWVLLEYQFSLDDREQRFHERTLHPLVSDSVLEKELASIPELLEK